MIYLDYSATTPVNPEVLDSFNKACNNYIGNANSSHKLGINIHNLIKKSTEQIMNVLNISNNKEIVYTSGSSEANNLAIKGVALRYKNRGKHIITSRYEHSSVNKVMEYLESIGYEISYVNTNEDGIIDINNLKEIIRDDTILVSINAINSEIGLKEPINEIGLLLKEYPKCIYHVDLTQAIGKINVDFTNIDLASFSAHKIYGLKGIGCLVKNKNIDLIPLIHGGKSTTIYRSGTPAHPLIVSMSKAVRLACIDLDKKYDYVSSLNSKIKNELSKLDNVFINSNKYSIPHILNISVLKVKAETFMRALEDYDIYVSTKTACSDDNSYSENVYDLTKDMERAKSSIRISLSHLTTEEEVDTFIQTFKKCYDKLLKNNEI
jgi:cysteine desulfurase